MAVLWTEYGQDADVRRELIPELRRALAHLYDPVYLQRSPLIAWLLAAEPQQVPAGQEVKALRKLLLEMIDELKPGENVPLRSEEWRGYTVLRARFVDQLPMEHLAETLSLSPRQVRRELRAGLEAMAGILARRLGQPAPADGDDADEESAEASEEMLAEIECLGAEPSAVNLCAQVRDAASLVASLASTREVEIDNSELPQSALVRSNRVVLRQALLSLYSRAIEHFANARIAAQVAQTSAEGVALELHISVPTLREAPGSAHFVPPELLQMLQGSLYCAPCTSGELVLRLSLPSMPLRAVLLVDDNRSLHQLFWRYLCGLPYRLLSAYDAATGLVLAHTEQPQVIVLDIMMPNRDGWELLNTLRDDPLTRGIPIVVCSVLDQEALARSLGACGYIRKPVTQESLIGVLQSLGLHNAP